MPIIVVPPIDGTPIPPGPTPSAVAVVNQPAPLMPLDTFREWLGYNPFYFWQLSNAKVPVTSGCNTLIYEYAWQYADQIGRNAMRQALVNAQNMLQQELGFSIAPHYVEETKPYFDTSNLFQYPADPYGRWVGVNASEGYIQAVGIEKITLLGSPTITLSDTDGDGLYDTFAAVIATTETDPLRLAVYFSAAYRLNGEGLSESWRIEPVNITIASGFATIKGRSWTVIRPILYQGVPASNGQALDPDDVTNYVLTVDVATRTTDPSGTTAETSQGVFQWETNPLPYWWGIANNTPSTDPATFAYAVARVGIRNEKLGILIPGQAFYNPTTGIWSEEIPFCNWYVIPDRIQFRYLAGLPLQSDGQMDRNIQAAVAHLTIAEIQSRICGCDPANRELYYWQVDISRTGTQGTEMYSVPARDLSNPWGYRRGHIDAWKRIKYLKQVRALAMG